MSVGAKSYRFLSEFIINSHYAGLPNDDATITQRHIAERIAMKVAKRAVISAFGNSNQGESTYANDQFVSVFYDLPLLTDSNTTEEYFTMPATPAGMPNNQEIVQVFFASCPNMRIVPMKQKDAYAQSKVRSLDKFSEPNYVIENGRIVFKYLPTIVTGNPSVKMIGAVPGDTLLDSVLNVPKDVEDAIVSEILQELVIDYSIKPDVLNNAVS